jgi:SAM-dependent methyltransferase
VAFQYDVFAPWFDAWQRAFGPPYDDLVLPRILALLARFAPAPRRLADLGSGTGDLAIALARAGYAVVGVDCSAPMREVARRKAADAGLAAPPAFVDGDLRTLALDPPADAAVCVYTVMNQLTADGDFARAAGAVARSLVRGGVFVFELNLPAAYARFWTAAEATRVDGATIRRTHRRLGRVIEARITIEPDGAPPIEDRILQRAWDDAEVAGTLDAAGLDPIGCERFDPFGGGGEPTKALWTARRTGR